MSSAIIRRDVREEGYAADRRRCRNGHRRRHAGWWMLKDVIFGRRRCRIHLPEGGRDALQRDGIQPAIG